MLSSLLLKGANLHRHRLTAFLQSTHTLYTGRTHTHFVLENQKQKKSLAKLERHTLSLAGASKKGRRHLAFFSSFCSKAKITSPSYRHRNEYFTTFSLLKCRSGHTHTQCSRCQFDSTSIFLPLHTHCSILLHQHQHTSLVIFIWTREMAKSENGRGPQNLKMKHEYCTLLTVLYSVKLMSISREVLLNLLSIELDKTHLPAKGSPVSTCCCCLSPLGLLFVLFRSKRLFLLWCSRVPCSLLT